MPKIGLLWLVCIRSLCMGWELENRPLRGLKNLFLW